MKYKGSLGVGGVLSAIGLLSVEGAPVPQEKLVDYLCTRFSVDRMDVYDVLDDAECDDLVQKSSDGLRVVDETVQEITDRFVKATRKALEKPILSATPEVLKAASEAVCKRLDEMEADHSLEKLASLGRLVKRDAEGHWPVTIVEGELVLTSTVKIDVPVTSLQVNMDSNEIKTPIDPDVHILQFFTYSHLPKHLQEVSKPFGEMAAWMGKKLPSNPEKTVALRKLLEAKDAAIRAFLVKDA